MIKVLNLFPIRHVSENPNKILFRLTSSMSSSTKIVAEYAKSGRSSCKKCSDTIAAKDLRVGLVSRDARGFDMTRWHHLRCFDAGSGAVDSPEAIKGFSSLKSCDQEALKALINDGSHSTGENAIKGKDANEVDKEGNSEISRVHKRDEDKSNDQEDMNLKKIKVVAEYAKSGRSSCKKCSEMIVAKDLRVGLVSRDARGFDMTRWHHLRCFNAGSGAVDSPEAIKGFSSLKSCDQEALKALINDGSHSTEENAIKGMDAIEGDKEGNSEISRVYKRDEDKSDDQEDMNLKKIKVVAEYAKSSRSSCKRCSEMIVAKDLRVGLVRRDARGFDMTRWHHLRCFDAGSGVVDSPEAIKGFLSLKNCDQEELKALVNDGSRSTEENTIINKDAIDRNKEQNFEISKVHERDEDKSDDQEDMNSKKIKMSILVKEVKMEILFSASEVKAKYKEATLPPKWKAFQTVIFLEREEGLKDFRKIAAFDFDGCLANTSVKRVGADAWSLMYSSIPEKLQKLYSEGFKLVIFTNESNIDRWKNKRQVAIDSKIGRLESFIKRVNVPMQVYIACGLGKSVGKDDPFRKPKPGMWYLMAQQFNSGISVDMDQSFYVGDAAGRANDHSDADIKFAEAIGLKFYLPEDYFST